MTNVAENSLAPNSRLESLPVTRARILVVDDERLNREMLALLLRKHNYEVGVAASGKEAVAMVVGDAYDLVLLDVVMPDQDGFDVLKDLRELASAAELPVIMCTSAADSQQVVEAFNHGANDYITKPFDVGITLARIEMHLNLKRTQSALRESEERYALAARGTNDGLWDWNLKTDRIYYSPRWRDVMGCSQVAVGDSPEAWWERIHADDRDRVRTELSAVPPNGSETHQTEFRTADLGGGQRWVLCRWLAVRDQLGRPTRLAGSIADVTSGKVSDPLTGLPNRLLFLDRVGHRLRSQEWDPGLFAVLFLDLDNFKLINDSLGHEAGDQLLTSLADRIVRSVRSTDTVALASGTFSVARLGGDEFTILLDQINAPKDAEVVAERILTGLAKPFTLRGREVSVSASIGITVGPGEHKRAEDLLREADTAMYYAKAQGRSCARTFDASMQQRAEVRLALENDLRHAVERDEIDLHYQPIYSLSRNRIIGAECLARWYHPLRGLVMPVDFVSVAEETGLIVSIGRTVLRKACAQAAEWQRHFPHLSPMIISVNVSCKQFGDAELVSFIRQTISETGIDPASLKLEVTESTLMESTETAVRLLSELREMQIQVGLDDFGTGYSSLAVLHRLPLDVLKIDRSFVQEMTTREGHAAIVKTIIALARNLGFDVIAEGVETAEQASKLLEMGCDHAQGFYFSRPVDAATLESLLETGDRAADP